MSRVSSYMLRRIGPQRCVVRPVCFEIFAFSSAKTGLYRVTSWPRSYMRKGFFQCFLHTDYNSCCRIKHSTWKGTKYCVVGSKYVSVPEFRRPLIRRTACAQCHTTKTVLHGIAAIHVTLDLRLLENISWTCARFLIILANMLGAQDTRNVTTRIGTWQPRERAEIGFSDFR
jgi:hypothetical protein